MLAGGQFDGRCLYGVDVDGACLHAAGDEEAHDFEGSQVVPRCASVGAVLPLLELKVAPVVECLYGHLLALRRELGESVGEGGERRAFQLAVGDVELQFRSTRLLVSADALAGGVELMFHDFDVVAAADGDVQHAVILHIALQRREPADGVAGVLVYVLPLGDQVDVGGQLGVHVELRAPAEEHAALAHGLGHRPLVEDEALACGFAAEGECLAVGCLGLGVEARAAVQGEGSLHLYGLPYGGERHVLVDGILTARGAQQLVLVRGVALQRAPCCKLLALWSGRSCQQRDCARTGHVAVFVGLAHGNLIRHARVLPVVVDVDRLVAVKRCRLGVGHECGHLRRGVAADQQVLPAGDAVPVGRRAHHGAAHRCCVVGGSLLGGEEGHLRRCERRQHLHRPYVLVAHLRVLRHARVGERLLAVLRHAEAYPYVRSGVGRLIEHRERLLLLHVHRHRQDIRIDVGHGHPLHHRVRRNGDALLLGVVDVVFIFVRGELRHRGLFARAQGHAEVVALGLVHQEHEALVLLHLVVSRQRRVVLLQQCGRAACAAAVGQRHAGQRVVQHLQLHVALRHVELPHAFGLVPGHLDGFGLLLQVAAVRRQLRHRKGGLASVVARQFRAVIEHIIAIGHCLSAPAVAYVYVF